jgi:hypothetical protein
LTENAAQRKNRKGLLPERKVFDHFPGVSPALIAVLKKLHDEIVGHLEKIEKPRLPFKDAP